MAITRDRMATGVMAAAVGLLALAGQTSAQDAGRGSGSTQAADPGPEPDARSDQPGRSQMLSAAELGELRAILERRDAPDEQTGLETIEPGVVIPRPTKLVPVPKAVADIAPGYEDYSFARLDGRLCIVDPQTLVVIAVLP